jgi:EAL domain-containing protein (putative c-di-GMP-specific phosphodiesterase class I)
VERNHQIDLALSKCPFEREFSVVYQPQFAVGGRRLVGMEALARWNSREFGTIPPTSLSRSPRRNGVILPLSDWVMEKSLRQIASWNKKYGSSCRMGINVSPVQLDDDTFLQRLELLLTETERARNGSTLSLPSGAP